MRLIFRLLAKRIDLILSSPKWMVNFLSINNQYNNTRSLEIEIESTLFTNQAIQKIEKDKNNYKLKIKSFVMI